MKKFAYIIFIIILLLITGCGAKINYQVDVDTEERTIQINTSLEVDESDYQYIKGGRDKLLSVMQKEKPDHLEFSVDRDNENRFLFSFNFKSYDDYLSKYKSITGESSKSTFEVGEYSKESPFQAYQNIKFEDDLSNLLNWLEEALINSGSVENEHKDSLVNNQNYEFIFDDQSYSSISYQHEYEGKSIIPITKNNMKVVLKKENRVDFLMSLYIDMDKVGDLTDNLSSYMKERGINLRYEEVQYDDKTCMKYDIQMNNLDLSSEEAITKLNSVFGEGFGYGHSESVTKKSFIKDDNQQTLNLGLDFHSLFGLGIIHPVEIVIDVDGVALDEEQAVSENINMPFTFKELDDGKININLKTAYTSYHFITITIFFLITVVAIGCLWKYGFKKVYHQIRDMVQIGYQKLFHINLNHFYEEGLRIKGNVITGESFTIQISNINKIHYGYQHDMIASLYKYIGMAFVGYILQMFNDFKIIGYTLIIIAVLLTVMELKRCFTKALYIKLASGKEYSIVFKEQDKAVKTYHKLLDIVEKQNELEDLEEVFTSLERLDD